MCCLHKACQDSLLVRNLSLTSTLVWHRAAAAAWLNILHNDVKSHNCLLKHKVNYLKLADLANST